MNCRTSGSPAFTLATGRGWCPPGGGSWSMCDSARTSVLPVVESTAMILRSMRACSARAASGEKSRAERMSGMRNFLEFSGGNLPLFHHHIERCKMLVVVGPRGRVPGFQPDQVDSWRVNGEDQLPLGLVL